MISRQKYTEESETAAYPSKLPMINKCPWCLNPARLHEPDDSKKTNWWVWCISGFCRASGPGRDNAEDAIKAWNAIHLERFGLPS